MARNPHYLSQLAHIEIVSPDVDASVRFFTEVAGLDETGRDATSVYLRAWGDYFHHTLKMTKGEAPALGHLGWRADGPKRSQTWSRIWRRPVRASAGTTEISGMAGPIASSTPEGHTHEVFWDVGVAEGAGERHSIYADRYASNRRRGINPRRFDHVTYMVCEVQVCRGEGVLDGHGAAESGRDPDSDEIPPVGGLWTIANLSHDIAVFTDPNIPPGAAVFNHFATNLDSREEVLLALDWITENGLKSVMGAPTRHKADEGFFIYVTDPGSGYLVEFYSGARLIFAPDHGPDVHYLRDNPNDAWGLANPFAEMDKGHRLGLKDGCAESAGV